jgi:hypothetical protein
MAQFNELPVYKATYDLLLAIFQFTKEFSREYKYTVGESLKKETIELLTLIYRANSRYKKSDVLQIAREQIEVIRLLIRVMKDMKQISLNKFVTVNKSVENVSKQLSGWQKVKNSVFCQSSDMPRLSEASILNPVTR